MDKSCRVLKLSSGWHRRVGRAEACAEQQNRGCIWYPHRHREDVQTGNHGSTIVEWWFYCRSSCAIAFTGWVRFYVFNKIRSLFSHEPKSLCESSHAARDPACCPLVLGDHALKLHQQLILDFAIRCPLVRPRMPLIRFLFVRSRFCSTLPPDPASRRRPCASLALRLHQAVQRTFTSKLSNMPGTQRNR